MTEQLREVLLARLADGRASGYPDPGVCWEWQGYRDENGYGKWRATGFSTSRSSHRIAWELLRGPIPEGLVIDHQCRNRACCNPEHLRVVTPRINSIENSLSPTALNAAKELCKRGHELEDDPYPDHSAKRWCRTCSREASREWHARRYATGDTTPATPIPLYCRKGLHHWVDDEGNPTEHLSIRTMGQRSCKTCATNRVRENLQARRSGMGEDRKPSGKVSDFCRKGHRLLNEDGSFTADLRVRTDGRTECKECARIAERARYERKRLSGESILRST